MDPNIEKAPSEAKRSRSQNYSLEEKSYLLQLVEKYKDIVENKKTDGATNVLKERTWHKIAVQFNSQSPGMVRRDANSLCKLYKNIKKDVRKTVAEEKMELIKTGGGPSIKRCNNPLQEQALATMNLKTVYGLDNPWDSDNVKYYDIGDDSDILGANTGVSAEQAQERKVRGTDNVPHLEKEDEEVFYVMVQNENSDNIGDSEQDNESEVDNEFNWAKPAASDLNRQINPVLKRKITAVVNPKSVTQTDNNDESIPKLKNRRRPTASAVAIHSSEVSKLYSKVCEDKLVVVSIEKQIAAEELSFQQEKHRIELEMLKTELAMKKMQYEDCVRMMQSRK